MAEGQPSNAPTAPTAPAEQPLQPVNAPKGVVEQGRQWPKGDSLLQDIADKRIASQAMTPEDAKRVQEELKNLPSKK